jgi:hypothetical protein
MLSFRTVSISVRSNPATSDRSLFQNIVPGSRPMEGHSKCYNSLGIQVTLQCYSYSSLAAEPQGSTPLIPKPARDRSMYHSWMKLPLCCQARLCDAVLIKFKDICTSIYLLTFFSLFFSFPKNLFGRRKIKWEDDINMNLKWNYVCVRCGFIWLSIGTSGGLLWTRYWTFLLKKMLVIYLITE